MARTIRAEGGYHAIESSVLALCLHWRVAAFVIVGNGWSL
jgi:hypothetical protein